jgi:hypothetical protein
MRLSIEADNSKFLKQVKALRQHLDGQHTAGGQASVSARMMSPVLVPYLSVLRTELRDDVVPHAVLDGAADLIANIAKTTVQSLIEAPPEAEGQTIEELLMKACRIACQALVAEAEARKPMLSLVPPHPADTVIHMKTRGN